MFLSTRTRLLFVLAVLFAASMTIAEPAFALLQAGSQNPINFDGIESNLQILAQPVVGLVKNVLALLAALWGLIELFKAARNAGGSWFRALGLLVVAAIIVMPAFILNQLGATGLANVLRGWGF